MSDNGVTREGEALVKEWLSTRERVARLAAELNRAQCERDNAEIALSKWLLPPDSVVGEKVAVWFGDSLIQATARECVGSNTWCGPVIVRLRGPKFGEMFR